MLHLPMHAVRIGTNRRCLERCYDQAMTIIRITRSPEGFEHTQHEAGFAVLGWEAGSPVVALHGTRQALGEGWEWMQIGSEL